MFKQIFKKCFTFWQTNFRFLSIPKWVKSNEQKRERKKSVKTMASFACNRHHGWRMQTTWTKKNKVKWSSQDHQSVAQTAHTAQEDQVDRVDQTAQTG